MSGGGRADDEFVVLTRAFARTAVMFEAVEGTFAEMTVAAATSATAPTHTVTHVHRLHGGVTPRITRNLPRVRPRALVSRLMRAAGTR
jgi:hypothetical protein